ncbi:MAG: VWA domain-containing protein [Acidobacteriaceae bacterium]
MRELSSLQPRRQAVESLRTAAFFDARLGVETKRASTLLYWVALLVLITPANLARTQESSPSRGRTEDLYTFRVSVDMVILHATVQNHKHALVSGIRKENFQVYEDGVLQQIKYFTYEDIPVTVGLVVDNSGSMSPKHPDVVAAALAFARSSNPQDEMFVVNFNENVSFGLPVNTPFTDQAAQLETALSRIGAKGETALYDAIAAALEHLKQGNRDKKVLIVISDGGDNASKHKLNEVMALVGQPDAIIYTIGIFGEEDEDRNPQVLKRLAIETGGEAFFPESSKDIVRICQRIAHDIRNQYTLAYAPTNKKRNGTYRAIEVKARVAGRGRWSVRTRTGYYAPLEAHPSPAKKAIEHEAQN